MILLKTRTESADMNSSVGSSRTATTGALRKTKDGAWKYSGG